MMRKVAAVILIGAVVLGACAPASPSSPSPTGGQPAQPKSGGTLILARAGEVTNLDPHKVPAFTSARVFELLYSYLMRLDENLGVQPDLADGMPTTSSDGKTVTLKIRSGVKFHNGDPLTNDGRVQPEDAERGAARIHGASEQRHRVEEDR
jgi:peptide/nickel transport system substrate-binding protein